MQDDENIGTDSSATLVGKGGIQEDSLEENEVGESGGKKRGQWDNKIQYLLAQIGFAVGLGNVWRFPYLCQKNGGGAFLIPYFLMMLVEGIPLFYLEIAIGQRLRRGSVGVWNHIHPFLGGVGIASMVVCLFIALYYNMIIAWAMFYFLNSFTSSLPWSNCPTVIHNETNSTVTIPECALSSETSYFWYRETLDISPSIEESGGLQWRLVLCLLLAWAVVFAGLFKGIKSSGKVIYFSATFPYFVLFIFFFRAITLDGAVDGLAYMVTPDFSRLTDPEVWRDAATQIFFSLGLGFGGVIAYSSYNDIKNNCRKDAITVSLINSASSILASLVVFSILGFKAHIAKQECIDSNILHIRQFYVTHNASDEFIHAINVLERKTYVVVFDYLNSTMQNETALADEWNTYMNVSITPFANCELSNELNKTVSGPGLAFIAFTEAMIRMPGAPFWSVMFFSMLINLGLGSMFGTLEGIITPLQDLGLKIRKELIVGILCLFCFVVGLVFCLRSGMYVLGLFDTYAGTLPLLLIALFEDITVVYIYGIKKFSEDIDLMMGNGPPGWYWKIMWCVVSPLCMAILFGASLVKLFIDNPTYEVYVTETGVSDKTVEYPPWCHAVIVMLIMMSIIWIPLIAFLRWRGILKYISPDSQSKKNPKEFPEV